MRREAHAVVASAAISEILGDLICVHDALSGTEALLQAPPEAVGLERVAGLVANHIANLLFEASQARQAHSRRGDQL